MFIKNQVLTRFRGTIPLRNTTTRHSPRAPKIKEQKTGEGSSQRTTRQLEYVPRLEPIVKTETKKVFIEPLTFGDT
jgi:hypothetical protein